MGRLVAHNEPTTFLYLNSLYFIYSHYCPIAELKASPPFLHSSRINAAIGQYPKWASNSYRHLLMSLSRLRFALGGIHSLDWHGKKNWLLPTTFSRNPGNNLQGKQYSSCVQSDFSLSCFTLFYQKVIKRINLPARSHDFINSIGTFLMKSRKQTSR